MILGRAQALQYSLFRNFPTTENGDVDWSLFENGPPQYIADFLHRLEAGKSIKINCDVIANSSTLFLRVRIYLPT